MRIVIRVVRGSQDEAADLTGGILIGHTKIIVKKYPLIIPSFCGDR